MATLKAPFLSLGASGQLGKSLVASTWKGIKYMRQHVDPANPNTAAQQAQRGLVTTIVSVWRTFFILSQCRTAWNVYAAKLPTPMSGFNAFMRSALKIALTNPDASFGHEARTPANQMVLIDCLNIDDGDTGDEAGNFQVWVGTTKDNIAYLEDKACPGGTVTTSDLGAPGDVKFVQLFKDGYARSGIYEVTLV